MQRKARKRILSGAMSLLLAVSLLTGTLTPTVFAVEDLPADVGIPTQGEPVNPELPQEDAEQSETLSALMAETYALYSPGNTSYYVDAANGDDTKDGTTEANAWKSLEKANSMKYAPGDKLLLKAGGTWNGVLAPTGSGAPGNPIVIDRYGEGAKPILHGNGTAGPALTGTVFLYNVEYWEVHNLEVTNLQATDNAGETMDSGTAERAGILAFSSIQDRTLKHIVIKDCYVHDVNSNYAGGKTSGGIIIMGHYMDKDGKVVTVNDSGEPDVKAMGRAAYEDVLIEGNYVKNVAIEGIRNKCNTNIGSSGHGSNEFLKNYKNVVIRENYIEDVVGDGIVLTECKGGLIEGNVVKNSCGYDRGTANYAQCWTMFADDILIQYNEVYGNRYGYDDGEAFDSDMQNQRNVFQYNLSHDNGGGACLFMSNQSETIFRYNVSINDGAGTIYSGNTEMRQQVFHYDNTSSQGNNSNVAQIYNNTIYLSGVDNSTVLFGGKSKRDNFVNFKNNIVMAANGATVTFTHSDGSTIRPNSLIENNCFFPESIGTSSGLTAQQLATQGNIFTDPKLKSPANGLSYTKFALPEGDMNSIYGLAEERVKTLSEAYQITEGSPCIRAGQPIVGAPETDLFGTPLAGLIDIGAHEFSSEPETPSSVLPVTAITTVGAQPELPTTVEVVIESKPYTFGVIWNAITAEQLATAGTLTVSGTISGITGTSATATVHVVGTAESFEAVAVSTVVGVYPKLPTTVTAHFAENMVLVLPVIWNLLSDAELGSVGTVTLRGHVPSLPQEPEATATVTVAAAGEKPVSIEATRDTYIQNNTAGPFNTTATIQMKGSPDAGYGRRGLIDFDLSANAGAIQSASRIVLRLEVTNIEVKGSATSTAAGEGGNTERYVSVYDAGNSWVDTVKWSDMADAGRTPPTLPVAADDTLFVNKNFPPIDEAFVELDVTDYVKDSGKTSFGFLVAVVKQGATNVNNCGLTFAAIEHSTRAAPSLRFEYNTVTAISPVEVSTPAKEAPVLPATVAVTYSASAEPVTKAVTWNDIPAVRYATAGATFTVQGAIAGMSRPAVATVTVIAPLPTIVSTPAIAGIRAATGTAEGALGLPRVADAVLSNGTTVAVPVSYWFPEPAYNPGVARDYSYLGVFNVDGLDIRNYSDIRPAVTVTLVQTTDKNILVYGLMEAQKSVRDGTVDLLIPSAKAALEAAVLAADAAYRDLFATHETVQTAYEQLQAAIWNLSYVKADKDVLTAAIAKANAITLTAYTKETVAAVRTALTAASALADNVELSVGDQSAVNGAATALTRAVAALSTGTGTGVVPRPPSGGNQPAAPTHPTTPAGVEMKDVPADAWYAAGVQSVLTAGLMNGTGEGFSPALEMSRAMLLTVLFRMDGAPAQSGVAKDTWYSDALAWSVAAGISDGANPNGALTREQVAVMLFRYHQGKPTATTLQGFGDTAEVSDWAKDAMIWAVEQGILNGKDGGKLDPQGTATRAEMAVILMRLEQTQKKG